MGFYEILRWKYWLKFVDKFYFRLKSDDSNRHFTFRLTIFSHSLRHRLYVHLKTKERRDGLLICCSDTQKTPTTKNKSLKGGIFVADMRRNHTLCVTRNMKDTFKICVLRMSYSQIYNPGKRTERKRQKYYAESVLPVL